MIYQSHAIFVTGPRRVEVELIPSRNPFPSHWLTSNA